MFAFLTKSTLTNAILNVSRNFIGTYSYAIKQVIEKNTTSQEELEKELWSCRGDYLDNVSNSVIQSFHISSPKIDLRIQLALSNPALCGYPDINLDNSLLAGELYAICFYAVENKPAAPKDCIKLNHLQNRIMNQALDEIEKEK